MIDLFQVYHGENELHISTWRWWWSLLCTSL